MRPPAPKADSNDLQEAPIFMGFCFKQMRGTCLIQLSRVEAGGFGSYKIIYRGK
jgi:hypothetical protein